MSQYGARAMAEDGKRWRAILRHYYSDVDIDGRGNKWMRVLLSTGRAVKVGGPEGYVARWADGTKIRSRSDQHPFTRVRVTDGGVVVHKGSSPSGPWTRIGRGTQHVWFEPVGTPAVPVWRNGRLEYFRGSLEAHRRSSSTLYAINKLRMNDYLYGVVPREMPALWHRQAVRAQAVAARSYSMWKRRSVGKNAPYHICATTFCQVYRGYGVRASVGAALEVLEHPRTNDAIDRTSGKVMVVDGEGPIFAEYHSTSGGHTGQGSRAYLAPVPDPWDKRYSPYHRWTAGIDVADIERRWPGLGRLVRIGRVKRNGFGPWGGRVSSMRFVGTDGNVDVSGETVRSAFGLRSTLFTIKVHDAAPAGEQDQVALAPGTTATATIRMRNTGTIGWKVGGSIRLGTADPKDRASSFRAPTWLSPTRVVAVTGNLSDASRWVSPGQIGEFRFDVTAAPDLEPGLYHETFRLYDQGFTWFGVEVVVPIVVGFAGAAHLGGNLIENGSFDTTDGSAPSAWRGVRGAEATLSTTAIDGPNALELDSTRKSKVVYKQVRADGGAAGERFVLSAWNRAHGVSDAGGPIRVRVVFRNKDGSRARRNLNFAKEPRDWTYGERTFRAPKAFRRIVVRTELHRQRGRAWFDGVRLSRQELTDGTFEAPDTSAAWTIVNGGAADGRSTVTMRQGTGALRLKGRAARNVYARQSLEDRSGKAGTVFRLGGWNRTVGSSEDGGAVHLRVRFFHPDGSASVRTLAFPRGEHGWVYNETLVAAPKDFSRVNVYARFRGQTGYAWFDDVVLSQPPDELSLSENAEFELGRPLPGSWRLLRVGESGAGISSQSPIGGASLYLRGSAKKNRLARQSLPLGGETGDRYVLSGWNRTADSDAGGGPVQVFARIFYVDGSKSTHRINFARSSHDWIRDELVVTAWKPYRQIRVYARFARQAGEAWFDSVRLVPATT